MNELWQRQNALMLTILSADWLYDWLPACNRHVPYKRVLTTPVREDFLNLAFLFLFGVVLKSMQNRAKWYKMGARTAKSEKIQHILKSGCDRSSYLTDILTDFSDDCNKEKLY